MPLARFGNTRKRLGLLIRAQSRIPVELQKSTFMQISDRGAKPLLLGLALALSACAATGPAPKEVTVNVGQSPVVIAAPGAL